MYKNTHEQARTHHAIDVMKGVLVVGMVTSHVNIFYGHASLSTTILKTAVNLVAFSGFLFCFGYAAYHAYVQGERPGKRTRLFFGTAKLFLAYVLSSSTYSMFREKTMDWDRLLAILTAHYLPLYNEFLVAFMLVSLLTLFFNRAFRWAIAEPRRALGIIVACLLTSVVPLPQHIGYIGQLFIGARGTSVFPVVQYLPFYIAGMVYASGYRFAYTKSLALAALCSGSAAVWTWYTGTLPARFPPSLGWLAGSVLPLTLLGVTALRFAHKNSAPVRWLAHLGANVLFYLVLSNIALFAYTRAKYGFGIGGSFLVSATVLSTITFLSGLVRPARRGD